MRKADVGYNYSLGLYEKAMPNGLSFRVMLENAAASGFDRLEISIDETDERLSRLNWTAAERAELKCLCFSLGVPITTMCLSGHRRFPFGSHEAAVRAHAMEIMEKAMAFSADIGVRVIQLASYDVYYEKGDADTRKWFVENLYRAVELAASSGVFLGFETMETPFMDTVGKAMEYVRLIGSPYLGIYPDIGNLKNASVLYGNDLVKDIALGGGHIFAGHLKETAQGEYRNRIFGDGHTEYVPCVKELWRQGVRMFSGEFWYLGEKDYMSTLKSASVFLREKIKESVREFGEEQNNG